MVMDFNTFLRQVIGGANQQPQVPNLPPSSQPLQSVPPMMGPMPVNQPAPVQPTLQQPVQAPMQQLPYQGPPPQTPYVMSPAEFAMQQNAMPQQGPVVPESTQYGGVWVTVEYRYNDKNYYILMPEENTANLPEGANVIDNGRIDNDPERVQIAIQAGETSPENAETKVGILDQMPPEIQGLFRSSEDVLDISSKRPISPLPVDAEGVPIPWDDFVNNPVDRPTTQIPVLNAQGQTPDQVQQDVQSFDQLMQNAAQRGPDAVIPEQNAIPPLTTEALRQTDPVKAELLEEAGIFDVPADKVAVQYADGSIRLAPISSSVPEGATIITYGGLSAPTTSRDGDLGLPIPFTDKQIPLPDNAFGEVLGLLAAAPLVGMSEGGSFLQRRNQDSNVLPVEREWIPATGDEKTGHWRYFALDENNQEITSARGPSLGDQPGMRTEIDDFATWQIENPEAAYLAQNHGYNGFEGKEAVWERYQKDRGWIQRTGDAIGTDPLNFILGPMNSVGRKALREASEDTVQSAVRDVTRAVSRGTDNVSPEMVSDFAAVPPVVNDAPIIRRGVGVTDESVDPASMLLGPSQRGPRRMTKTDAVPGEGQIPYVVDDSIPATSELIPSSQGKTAGDHIITAAAEILSIPDNILGMMVDSGVTTLGQLGRLVGKVPTGGGRRLGDAFSTTDTSVVRNETDNVLNTVQDVAGRNVSEPVTPTDAIPTAPIDDRIPISPASERLIDPATARPQPVADTPLSTDRPIGDLGELEGTPLARVVEDPAVTAPAAQPQLAVDRPVDPNQLARDADFRNTDIGRQTDQILESWEQAPYLRPQTADQRLVGEGRVGSHFKQRPIDIARAMAPEFPEKWQGFLREYDRGLKRNKYMDAEDARKSKFFGDFQSTRFPDQKESGFSLKKTYEVLLEADNTIRTEMPIFNKHFGTDAEVPPYAWKRWGTGDSSHTALDTLESNGGIYKNGMNLEEATELAIFHPDNEIRDAALNDIELRLSQAADDGSVLTTRGGDSIVHKKLKGTELEKILSRARDAKFSIRRLRDDYDAVIEANRGMDTGTRLTADDAELLSQRNTVLSEPQAAAADPVGAAQFERDLMDTVARDTDLAIANESESLARDAVAAVDDPVGANIYDADLARTALEDVPQAARDVPLGPASPPNTPGFTGPRTPTPDLAGGTQVPTGVARDKAARVSALRDLKAKRATDARDMTESPLTKSERMYDSRREYLDNKAESRANRMRNASARMSENDLESFYVRGRSVSSSEAQVFGQKFENGESLAARWDRYTLEEVDKGVDLDVAERLAASRMVNDYSREIMPDNMRLEYDREYAKAIKSKVENEAGDKINRTELEAQMVAMDRVRYGPGKKGQAWRKYDTFVSGLRKTFLYNWLTGPRYVVTQLVGNTLTAGVTGNANVIGDIASPNAIRTAWRTAHNDGVLPESLMTDVYTKLGLHGRRELTRGSAAVRDQTIESAASASVKKGNSLLGKYTAPLADRRVRDMAAALDQMPREGMAVMVLGDHLPVARRVLRERMVASAPSGVSASEVGRIIDDLPFWYSSDDLRDAFTGFDARWVDRNARDWQEALYKTDKAAQAEVKRVFFDGTEKNVDVYLKRVLFFHYWMSRATPLYTEAIARNPVFLNNFVKLQEATSDDSDLSGSKFFKIFGTPMGYNILIRPDAMFATFASLMDDAGYEPDGESRLGKILRNSPVMLNPLVSTTFNLMGVMGDTFASDPLGLNKFISAGQAAIDLTNAELGLGLPPVGNSWEKAFRYARDFVSKGVNPITPDFITSHVEYTDPMDYKNNEVRTIVGDIALERGLSLDDPIVQDAMYNPESELYQEAMKRYSRQDVMDIGMRILPITAVLYPKSQLASPKQRTSIMNDGRDTQEQSGVLPSTFTNARDERDTFAAQTEYSRNMQQWQNEYQMVGTPEGKAAYGFYNKIRFNNLEAPINVGGVRYTPDQLAAMDDAGRESLADLWAEETGNTERIDTYRADRAAFRDEHPEYAEFVTWQNQIGDYEGGAQKWWEDTIQGNPNAARWYGEQDEEYRSSDMNLKSLEAYFAYQGDQLASWDGTPIETRTEVDPRPYNPMDTATGDGGTDTGGGTSQPKQRGPSKESIAKDIQQYEADKQAYNDAASMMLGQPVIVDQINPMARSAVESNLADMGIQKPRMSGYLYDYMQWAQAQGGGDTSVTTYLAWWQTQNPETPAVETPAA